jgi:hypothetical protein
VADATAAPSTSSTGERNRADMGLLLRSTRIRVGQTVAATLDTGQGFPWSCNSWRYGDGWRAVRMALAATDVKRLVHVSVTATEGRPEPRPGEGDGANAREREGEIAGLALPRRPFSVEAAPGRRTAHGR